MSRSTRDDATSGLVLARLAKTDLHLLSVFMTVVEAGGFSTAQVALNVGQSTISRHMADLETRLGMRLCQRGRVGFRLTEEGRMVHGACQKMFGALEEFRTEVGAISGQLVGELSVAVIDNWVSDRRSPLTAALRDIKARGADLHVNIHVLAPDEIELAVLDGRVALGVGVFHHHRPGLAYDALYDDPLELYCGRDHPLFDRASKPLRSKDHDVVDYVRRGYLAEEKISPLTAAFRSTATAHQVEGVASMILTGLYVGYLPVSFASRWVDDGLMRSVMPSRFRMNTTIEIVTRRSAALSLVARTFVDALKDNVARDQAAAVSSKKARH